MADRPEPTATIENGLDLLFLVVPQGDHLFVHLECRHARTELTVRASIDAAPEVVGRLIVQHREAIARTERQVCLCEPITRASVH